MNRNLNLEVAEVWLRSIGDAMISRESVLYLYLFFFACNLWGIILSVVDLFCFYLVFFIFFFYPNCK